MTGVCIRNPNHAQALSSRPDTKLHHQEEKQKEALQYAKYEQFCANTQACLVLGMSKSLKDWLHLGTLRCQVAVTLRLRGPIETFSGCFAFPSSSIFVEAAVRCSLRIDVPQLKQGLPKCLKLSECYCFCCYHHGGHFGCHDHCRRSSAYYSRAFLDTSRLFCN